MAIGSIKKPKTPYVEVEYNVTPTQNGNVSPFSYYGEQSIADDVALYGEPIGIYLRGAGSTNPACCKFSSAKTSFWYYSAKNTAAAVVVVFPNN